MNRATRSMFAVALLLIASVLSAQDVPVQVRTFMLKHLNPEDAAALVSPYVDHTPQGGVFRAGAVRGLTVRGTAPVLMRVDSLLKANDIAPAAVRLTYQLIAALDSNVSDPAIASIESELRKVLKFAGYRLVSQGSVVAGDQQSVETTLANGLSEPYLARTAVHRIEIVDRGSVRLSISLEGHPFQISAGKRTGAAVMSTGLTIPLGQSVVVASGAGLGGGTKENPYHFRSLILVVRADPVSGRP